MKHFLFLFFIILTISQIIVGQPFVQVNGFWEAVPGVVDGTAIWGDYDQDGDFDILITGKSDSGPVSEIYRNEGNDNFVLVNAGLMALTQSSASWADFDNDNDLDILISGIEDEVSPNDPVTILYQNIGNDTFRLIPADLEGVANGCSNWADFDSDGDQDLLLSGNEGVHGHTILYCNEGNGVFTEVNILLEQILSGEARWGDYDNDGDPDILLSGNHKNQQGQIEKISAIYRNDGGAEFTNIHADMSDVDRCNVSWVDYDADGDLDILTNGSTYGPTHMVYIYQNLGSDYFFTIGIEIFGTVDGSISWGDYDSDGDLDFLISGKSSIGDQIITEVYRNINFGLFNKDDRIDLIPLYYSSSAWADYDRDGDLDLLMSGNEEFEGDRKSTILYKNTNSFVNALPYPPEIQNSTVDENTVTLQWSRGSDAETPQLNLTYNVRLGTAPGTGDIISALSARGNMRQLSEMGNMFQNVQIKITDLLPANYFWSVQSIDNQFDISEFSTEETFTITSQMDVSHQKRENHEIVCTPNPFSQQTAFRYAQENLDFPETMVIIIMDAFGKIINQVSQSNRWVWDGTNNKGVKQKSGIYMWMCTDGIEQKGKIIFISN